jgi:hypothetical protein
MLPHSHASAVQVNLLRRRIASGNSGDADLTAHGHVTDSELSFGMEILTRERGVIMGKASRRKKLDISNKGFKLGYIRNPSWEDYDILEVNEEAIVAKRKDTGVIQVFIPVAPWVFANLLN